MSSYGADIGIDFGSDNIRVYMPQKGVVIDEASVVVFHRESELMLDVGDRGRELILVDPRSCVPVRPLIHGSIRRYDAALLLMKRVIWRVAGGRGFTKPRVVVAVPSCLSDVEARGWITVATEAGAREVMLLEAPIAAAIGAEMDVFDARAQMVIDVGAGVTDIGVIAVGEIVLSDRVNTGGRSMNAAIQKHLRSDAGLVLGDMATEDVKIKVAVARDGFEPRSAVVHGRDLKTGLPLQAVITTEDVARAIGGKIEEIVEGIRCALRRVPVELMMDISNCGVVLTGGASRMRGFPDIVSERLGMPIRVARDPEFCVIRGIGEFLSNGDPRMTKAIKSV
jgi:rod shape-determining protein MreB